MPVKNVTPFAGDIPARNAGIIFSTFTPESQTITTYFSFFLEFGLQ